MKMTGHFLLGAYRRKKEWVGPIPPTFEHEEWIPTERGDLQNPFNRFIRFVISFSDGTTLALSDLRRFARIEFFDTLRLENEFKKFGHEPLEKSFTFTVYKKQILKRTTGKIKTILMDQSIIAGIGNIYSDEILYSADVHPESNPSRIPHAELKKIYTAMRLILKKSIRLGGDSMSDYRKPDGTRGEFQNCHNAYRRTGKPCKKRNCSGIITRKKVGGRSAHFCPIHQKLY
jgi:formamidopyrimidine-DNA glycosylase